MLKKFTAYNERDPFALVACISEYGVLKVSMRIAGGDFKLRHPFIPTMPYSHALSAANLDLVTPNGIFAAQSLLTCVAHA